MILISYLYAIYNLLFIATNPLIISNNPHQDGVCKSFIPILHTVEWKISQLRPLVKTSASWFSDLTKGMYSWQSVNFSLMKCLSISTYFVLSFEPDYGQCWLQVYCHNRRREVCSPLFPTPPWPFLAIRARNLLVLLLYALLMHWI